MASFGSAPTTRSTSMPFAKNRSVGIAVILKLAAIVGVLIDVALAEGHPAGEVTRKVLDDRGHHPAGAAPFRPDVDDQSGVLLQDLLERTIGDLDDTARRTRQPFFEFPETFFPETLQFVVKRPLSFHMTEVCRSLILNG